MNDNKKRLRNAKTIHKLKKCNIH